MHPVFFVDFRHPVDSPFFRPDVHDKLFLGHAVGGERNSAKLFDQTGSNIHCGGFTTAGWTDEDDVEVWEDFEVTLVNPDTSLGYCGQCG